MPNIKNTGLRVAGTIFGLVGILHLLRIITDAPVLIAEWSMPMWVNWLGALGASLMCGWMWRLSSEKE